MPVQAYGNRTHNSGRRRRYSTPRRASCSSSPAGSTHGDHGAREALVRRYMPLARSLARRYGRSSEPFEDLLQVASLGLLKALDRYDPDRGFAFKAFAVPTVLGEMRRYFRDSGWAVHVPRSVQERSLKVRGAQEHLTNQAGPRADGQRHRPVPRARHRGGDRRPAGDPVLRDGLPGRAGSRRRRGRLLLRRVPRRRGRALRARGARRDRRLGDERDPGDATGRSCTCASSRISRSRR